MVRLIVNPAAGRGHAARFIARLERRAAVDVRNPEGAAALVAETRRAVDDGLDRVIVAGGDGTLHQAAAGLAGSDCALAILPCGTGNDFARSLGLDLHPERAVETALEGTPRRIDLGRVDGRPYLCVAGVGFDGAVLRFLRERGTRRAGPWVYGYAVLRTLASFEAPRVSIELDGEQLDGPATLAVFANASTFGGGMKVAPQARLDDGLLDLVLVNRVSRLALLRAFPRIYAGRHTGHPAVTLRRVRRARLSGEASLHIHADGEPVAQLAPGGSEIDVWPQALAVVTR